MSYIELLDEELLLDSADLLARSGVRPEDVAVLSGTLLEGFGNRYSDLDLYVIGHELPLKGPEVPAMLVVREDGRIRRVNESLEGTARVILDIQYYTFRELSTLARSLTALYSEARQSTQIFRKTLHHDDEDLIHKLLTGTVLQDGTGSFNAHQIFSPAVFSFLK